MTKIKESNLDEYIDGMKKYAGEVKKMNAADSKKALIRIGVLTPDGKPKKQICTGANYGR